MSGEAVILASNTIPGTDIEGLQRLQLITGLEGLFAGAEEPLGLESPRIGPVVLRMVHRPVLHFNKRLNHRVSAVRGPFDKKRRY